VTPDGKPLNPDIYLQGRCVAMKSVSTTTSTNKFTPPINRLRVRLRVRLVDANAGLWYKADCNGYYGFFCSKNFATPTIIQPTTPPPGNCPSGNRHYFLLTDIT
jgi:hypothetical protein